MDYRKANRSHSPLYKGGGEKKGYVSTAINH